MKIKLFPLRLNELLGFVHFSHSSIPESSTLILAFNSPTAVWRFILAYRQSGISARGLQHSSNINMQAIRRFGKVQDN